jgi:SAM-dependent methyltransferase
MPAAQQILHARQRLPAHGRRVLVIDDRVPLSWLGQGYPRAACIVAELAAAGHAVTHYPLQFPHESRADIMRALPETVEVLADLGLAGLAGFLEQRAGFYDLVFVSRPHNMEVLQAVLREHEHWMQGARIVFDAEALFSLRDIAKLELTGQALPQAEQEARIRAELELADRADAVVTVSEREARHYREHRPGRPVHVIGHSLQITPGTQSFAERRGFLFVGALLDDDTPNADSLVWFIGEVWPKIQTALGARAVLNVVGPCSAPRVQALAAPDIVLHGASESLAPHMDAARVFVVPTRYAAGIPFKAHEAAAHGLPIVSTRLIAEQLGWEDLLPHSDDPDRFAQACIDLHEDADRWQQARQAMLDAVERDCAPALVRHVLARVVEGRPPLDGPLWPVSPEHRQRLQTLMRWLRAEAGATAGAGASDVEATAEHWGRDAQLRLNELNGLRYWTSHPILAPEINRLVSDDEHTGWIGHLKRRYFAQPARRGLSLGCGGGAAVCDCVALDIVQHMDGLDISPAAVDLARQRAAQAGLSERVRFDVANLNEARLTGPYDLIMFEQSLHHIEAMDRVLDACAAALAPEGLFVINEYVGPDRFQWSDDIQQRMDALLATLPARYRAELHDRSIRERVARLSEAAVMAVDPSEAIHSSQIISACAERFELVEKREFGGTLLQFMLAEIAANFDPDSEEDRTRMLGLMRTEQDLIRRGEIASTFVFAIYRARRH